MDYLKKVKKQIEFYFGEGNHTDYYFNNLIAKGNGYVNIEDILKFSKMVNLKVDLDTFIQAIKPSDVLEIKDMTIGRKTPLVVNKEDFDNRTIYTKGWPLNITNDQISETFEKYGYEPVCVRIIRDKYKKQLDMAWVTFPVHLYIIEIIKKCNNGEIKYNDINIKANTKNRQLNDYNEEILAKKEQRDELKAKKLVGIARGKKEFKPFENIKPVENSVISINGIGPTSVSKIKARFDMYGMVLHAEYYPDKGYALLAFRDVISVEKAITYNHQIGGKIPTIYITNIDITADFYLLYTKYLNDNRLRIFEIAKKLAKKMKFSGNRGRGGSRGRGFRGRGRGNDRVMVLKEPRIRQETREPRFERQETRERSRERETRVRERSRERLREPRVRERSRERLRERSRERESRVRERSREREKDEISPSELNSIKNQLLSQLFEKRFKESGYKRIREDESRK